MGEGGEVWHCGIHCLLCQEISMLGVCAVSSMLGVCSKQHTRCVCVCVCSKQHAWRMCV